ncbi:MAG: hypothetical protein J1F35_02595 [Erysipelotrichales bacterium]|nr:hypothetical protein [Erysipelotrichales bacterium]
MIIGLDIDNVIADLDKTLLEEFLKEDINKRNLGIINPNAEHMTQGMFDWTKEEINEFLEKNMERMAMKLELVKDAKFYIDKLRENGNIIYLITGRNKRHFKNPIKTTKKWLLDKEINYDKLIFTKDSRDKSKECLENKVDIMFDDRPINCSKLQENGINSYLFKTRYNYNYSLNVQMVDDWENLFNLIMGAKYEINK